MTFIDLPSLACGRYEGFFPKTLICNTVWHMRLSVSGQASCFFMPIPKVQINILNGSLYRSPTEVTWKLTKQVIREKSQVCSLKKA